MIVQDKLTPLSRQDAGQALLTAYRMLTGALPSQAVLALLLAQSALETGHWQKIHNFNFGNAKARLDYPLIVQFHCSEVDAQGVEHFFDPPALECNFRAYTDAAAGALDYLKVLQSRPHWWQGLHTENPSAFVDALATPPKYFTGNPAQYKRSVVSLFEGFRPLAEVALAVAAVAAVVPSPRSSSASPPSASSGAPPTAPPSGASSGAGQTPALAAPPPAPRDDSAAGATSSPSELTAEQGAGFWQQLLQLVRQFFKLFFGRPPKPPAGPA
jgi:hypothetical protein